MVHSEPRNEVKWRLLFVVSHEAEGEVAFYFHGTCFVPHYELSFIVTPAQGFSLSVRSRN